MFVDLDTKIVKANKRMLSRHNLLYSLPQIINILFDLKSKLYARIWKYLNCQDFFRDVKLSHYSPLRLQIFKTPTISRQWAHKVGRLSALNTGRLYPPAGTSSTYFCWKLSQPQVNSVDGRTESMKNPNDIIGNRTHNLMACNPKSYHIKDPVHCNILPISCTYVRPTTHLHPAPLLRMSGDTRSFSMHNFTVCTRIVTFTIREQAHPFVPVRTLHKARVRYYMVEGGWSE